MKKRIGEKIKEIRNANQWSQDSILPDRQSLLSQIEKGIIKNPGKEILETIASNLEMSFDKLIEHTDWDPTKLKMTQSAQYAYSLYNVSVELNKDGTVLIRKKKFPRYDENGKENRYDPETGDELITCCPNIECGRDLDFDTQQFCMACGSEITEYIYDLITEYYDHTEEGKYNLTKEDLFYINRDVIKELIPYSPTYFPTDFWYSEESWQDAAKELHSYIKTLNEIIDLVEKMSKNPSELLTDDWANIVPIDSVVPAGEERWTNKMALNALTGNIVHVNGEVLMDSSKNISEFMNKDNQTSNPYAKRWWNRIMMTLRILMQTYQQLELFRDQIITNNIMTPVLKDESVDNPPQDDDSSKTA